MKLLNDVEANEIYRNALKGLVSKNDLTESERAKVLQVAKWFNEDAIKDIHGLVAHNPNTDFEYWKDRHSGFIDSTRIIDWLTENKKNEPFQNIEGMEVEPFKPKTDIDEYLTDNWATTLFLKLRSNTEIFQDWDEQIAPDQNLWFFNLFFELVEFIRVNKGKPEKVLHHFRELDNISFEMYYFLVLEITQYLITNNPDKQTLRCIDLLIPESKAYNKSLTEELFALHKMMVEINKNNGKQFDITESEANGSIEWVKFDLGFIPEPTQKIKYLTNCIFSYKQKNPDFHLFFSPVTREVEFVTWCELEIERIKKVAELEGQAIGAKIEPKTIKPHHNTAKKEKRVKECLRIAKELLPESGEKISLSAFSTLIQSKYNDLHKDDNLEEDTVRQYFYEDGNTIKKFKDDHKNKFR